MFSTREQVIELKDLPQSSVGAPMPVVLSDEHNLYVSYYLQNTPENWDGLEVRVIEVESNNEPIAIVKFPLFHVYQFGPPNDEAFDGHHLYKFGLRPYGNFEVLNSKWISHFEKMNSVHAYHDKNKFRSLRHFIFSFHDTTLEVITRSYELETFCGSLKSAIRIINERLEW